MSTPPPPPSEPTRNLVILRPDKASPIKIVQFLWYGYIAEGEDAMISYGGEGEKDLKRKWLVSLTLLLQMILFWIIAKPVRYFGLVFEWFLHLPNSNRNWRELSRDLLSGGPKQAEGKATGRERSASFISIVGHTDKRVQLDENISKKDVRYKRALSAMAAKIAYENEALIRDTVTNKWQMELLDFYKFRNHYQGKETTKAFLLRDRYPEDELIVVAFKGTEFFDAYAWSTDLDISWYKYVGIGKVHGGFMKALGLTNSIGFPPAVEPNDKSLAYYTLKDRLLGLVKDNSNAKFIVTSHSLGGAPAILFVAILAFYKEDLLLERLRGVYTFGQPRVGDEEFKGFMKKQIDH